MSTVTWNGSAADWSTSGDWSGGNTPGALDTATISSGSVLVGSTESISAGSLSLTGGSLTVTGSLNLVTANGGGGYVPTVRIAGGNLTVDGGSLVFGSSLNQASGTVTVKDFGTVQWNGTSPSLVDGSTGSTSGLTIDLQSGYATFVQPFDGQIKDFGGNDALTFNGRITSESYSGNVLSVSTNAGITYHLNLQGNYQASNFAVGSGGYAITYASAPSVAAPVINGLTAATDSGTRGDDRTDKTPTISGTGINGDTVTVYLDNGSVPLGTTTVANGSWTFSLPTTPSAGSHSVTATQSSNGSTSLPSAAYNFVIDPVPQAPSVAGLTAATDTGASSHDGVTRDTTIGVQGTGTTGDTIQIYVDGGSASVGSTTVANGSWSIAALGGTLGEGPHTVSATQTDSHGNVSAASATYGVVVDTTAPTIVGIALDKTAYKLGDTVTATIQLAGAYDGNGAYTLGTGSTIDGAALTVGSFDATNNRLTASFVVDGNTSEVINGSVPVNIIVDDRAGNASTADTAGVTNETVDTHAPTAVSVAGLADGAVDTGTAPVAPGSAVGALSTTDASPSDIFTYALGGNDAGRFAISNGVLAVGGTALTDGTRYDLTVTSTDLGGNSVTQAIQITGATTPAVVSILPAGRSLTNAASDPFTVTFSQAVAGVQPSNFALSGTDGSGTVGTPTTADNGLTWTVPVTGVSGNGTLGLDLISTTGIASTSTGTALGGTRASDGDYTIDTTPPAVTITAPIAGDNTINAAEAARGATIGGTTTAEDGQTVTVRILNAGGTAVHSYTEAASGGAYSVVVTSAQAQALANGSYTVTADVSDQAGNLAPEATQAITVNETAPTITAVSDSGTGIDANGNGDLGAGKTVTLIVTTSEPLYVSGGAPTLTLNDGGTATYTGGSGTAQQTFGYTVAAGQNTANLAVTAVNANGATVTDAAGNPLDPSIMGAAVPSGTLAIDTTPPVASSPNDTVAQNSAPAPIGIAAPSDNLTAAGGLAIAAGTLPTDGAVTLADGTPVTAGQALTAAQLTGLLFTPAPGLYSRGSTFTYTVTDGAGNATTGTAALNVGGPGAPVIAGTHASATTSEAALRPFAGVTVSDPSTATETLTIALTGAGGSLSDGTGYGGLARNPDGSYRLTGSAAAVTAELDALSFTPTAGAAGTTSTTTFVLTDASSSGASVVDSGTSVADTDPAIVAPPTNNTQAPTPDAVSLSPEVSYGQGTFTLTGSASSASGVSGVEISAVLDDGTRQDLGAATLNRDGTFTFADRIGPASQSFFEATLTDGAGQQTTSPDPGFSLTGGLGRTGSGARQTTYTAGGDEIASTSLFRADGSRRVEVATGGQTVQSGFFDHFANHGAPSNTFVFDPGHGLDVVSGFRVGGADHDTLSFQASDFGNDIADVLRSAHNAQGGVVIQDPTSGDTVKLAGITKAQIFHHPGDVTLHA